MWVKLDDGFAQHPKILGISDGALRSLIASMCHCARYLTDGHVSDAVVRTIASTKIRRELVSAGLWDEAAGGIGVHDFGDWNPSREQVDAKRASDRERQRRHRENVDHDPDSGAFVSRRDKRVSHGMRHAVPVPSRPDRETPLAVAKGQSGSTAGGERLSEGETLPLADAMTFARLLQEVGGGDVARTKLERTIRANRLAEGDIAYALESVQKVGGKAKDPLGVALSALKRRARGAA